SDESDARHDERSDELIVYLAVLRDQLGKPPTVTFGLDEKKGDDDRQHPDQNRQSSSHFPPPFISAIFNRRARKEMVFARFTLSLLLHLVSGAARKNERSTHLHTASSFGFERAAREIERCVAAFGNRHLLTRRAQLLLPSFNRVFAGRQSFNRVI